MKLRYIIIGSSIFAWAAVIATILVDHFEIETFADRPILYFVILFAGALIGYGIAKGDK